MHEGDMEYKKSYESRKYGKPSKAQGRNNGPLTPSPDTHPTRKEPGQHKADAKSMIPHPRGCGCYMHTESGSKGHK